MKEYWLYTDEYPGDYNGPVPDDEWALCEFEYEEIDEDEVKTAVVTKVLAIGSNPFVAEGFEMELWDDAITSDVRRVIQFLFDRKFY